MTSPLSMLKKQKRVALPGPSGALGSDAYRGQLFPEGPPSDLELLSSMMQRLTQLEATVKSQAKELENKEKKITILERKLCLTEPKKVVADQEYLMKTCHRLHTQVTEMENFLIDYGLMWVGDGEESEETLRLGVEEAEQERSQDTEGTLWHPDTSAVAGFQVNFDLLLQNVRQLNLLAGEGESFVQPTALGAQLATREPVQLRLYSNGILMFEGPFRSHREASTQRCLQDLMDGYFPSELQERFPEGVPFQVHDHRHEEFIDRPLFSGKGLAVGAVRNAITSIPGRKLTKDQFLNRLPKVVIKGGKVIDIRSSVEATLQGSSSGQNSPVTFIDTPALRAMKERLEIRGSGSHPSADDVATLRVKSEDGNHSYILKMHISETIGDLRRYLEKHRGKGVPEYDVFSAFPRRGYSDESLTLACCGLTPSATLLLRPQKASSQSTDPSNSAKLKIAK
ncbi:unnamed protein product [Boreogadus saida]